MNLNKFIARRDNKIFYCSNEIGVKPILSKLNENINFYKDADIEDTVVGKAAESLYILARINFVYAHTLSESAKTYLEKNNIPFKYDELVKEIRNRTNTGMCPLEKSVIDIDDPILAKEAIEVILKSMEDYRDNLIIIFAGYTKEMKEFKEMNPGLKSRIGLTIEFPDYNADELTQIFVKKAQENGYNVPLESENKIHLVCDLASQEKDFGNGRFVENLFREVEINHALTTKDCDAYDTKILTILPEDIDVDILDKIL